MNFNHQNQIDTKNQFNITLGKLRGDYAKVTAWMKRKQVYTRKEMISYLLSLGKESDACEYTANTMLSPRKSSKRGDCRGNVSNPWGHLAYNAKMERKLVFGIKEDQAYKLRYRDQALPPRRRKKKCLGLEKIQRVNTKEVIKSATSIQQVFNFFD